MPAISNGERTYLSVRSHGLRANAVCPLSWSSQCCYSAWSHLGQVADAELGRGSLLWLSLECGSLWIFFFFAAFSERETWESSGSWEDHLEMEELDHSPHLSSGRVHWGSTSASCSCSLTDPVGKARLSRAPLVHSKGIHVVLAIWPSSERQDYVSEKYFFLDRWWAVEENGFKSITDLIYSYNLYKKNSNRATILK